MFGFSSIESSQRESNEGIQLGSILKLLSGVPAATVIEVVIEVWKLLSRLLPTAYQGMYEVLEVEAELELCDSKGKTAVYRKQEKVRFLQNHVFAYLDTAIGDGEIFAKYECSPGAEVDRYQEGHRWHVLISLRETKNRGDVEEFNIRRTIRDGFPHERESFQVEVNHKTRHLTMSAVFPKSRQPKRVMLIEQNRNRATALGAEHIVELPDGKRRVVWKAEKPRLFEAYILQWDW